MRRSYACAILVLAATGCTHLQLERSTIHQTATLTDLQYQQVLNNLAMLLRNQNKLAEAEPLSRKALEASRRVLGEEHPNTLSAQKNLAKDTPDGILYP